MEFKWWIYESRVNENFHKTHHNLNLERNHQFFSYSIYYGIRGCIKMVRIYENPKLPKGGLENSWFWQVMNLATLWVHALYIQALIENLSKESCSIWRDFLISYTCSIKRWFNPFFNLLWLGVKLPNWLMSIFLAITFIS